MKKQKKRTMIECECGSKIYGVSEKHAEANLNNHKKSKKHEQYLEIKKKLKV